VATQNSRTRPRVLVAEDHSVIAVMLYEDLSDAGFDVAGPFADCAAALGSLERHSPDAAILDIELSDGPCVALARALREKRIPFMILSGHTSIGSYDAAFADAPWLAKPMSHDDVIETVLALL
jgi:two-component system, response regulator PdtaR